MQPEITNKYGRVDITHVPAYDAISEALKIPTKERIEMIIKRPNPDDHAEAEQRFLERMRNRNIGVTEQSYKAVPGESIVMDDELIALAHISAKNGNLFIKGKDSASHSVEFSTAKHPWRISEYYNPELESAFELFSRTAQKMKEAISTWFRR